jgi:hypothetical protein
MKLCCHDFITDKSCGYKSTNGQVDLTLEQHVFRPAQHSFVVFNPRIREIFGK